MAKYKEKIRDPEVERFQKQLKDVMKMFGITDTELAEKLGVSRTQINNIKYGRCKMTKAQCIAIMVILSNSEKIVLERIQLKIGFAQTEYQSSVAGIKFTYKE